jgi:ABC-type dipeptide/oligopeptide/nickel transport system permease component
VRDGVIRAATFFAVFFYSMPTFLLGLILLYFLFFQLHLAGVPIFPGSGYVSIHQPGGLGPAPDPAVDRRGADHRCHLYPPDQGRNAGGPG